MAKWLSQLVQVGLPINSFKSGGRRWPRASPSRRQVGNSLVVREPIGVVGLHHAVELPAPPDRGQGGVRHGRRLHGRAQAQRGGPARRLHPGRGRPRGRPAGRRVQPRLGLRAGGRRGAGRAPGRGHGLVHRIDPRRQARRPARGRDDQEGRPRARGQVGQRAARRPRHRGLRQGRRGRRPEGVPQLRPDVLGADPHARPPRPPRGGRAGRRPRRVEKVKVGDPFAEGTHLGPLASAAQRERVEGYIQTGRRRGRHRRRRRHRRARGARHRASTCARPCSPASAPT